MRYWWLMNDWWLMINWLIDDWLKNKGCFLIDD